MIATKRILCVFIFAFFAAESELGTVRAARVLGDLQAASIPTQDPPKSDPQNAVAKGQLEEVPPNDSQSDHAFTTLENAHPEAFKALTKDLDLQKVSEAVSFMTNSTLSGAEVQDLVSNIVKDVAQQGLSQTTHANVNTDQQRLLFLQGLVNLFFTVFSIGMNIGTNVTKHRTLSLANQAKSFCELIVLSAFNCMIMVSRSLIMFGRYHELNITASVIGVLLAIVYAFYIRFEFVRMRDNFTADKKSCKAWLNSQLPLGDRKQQVADLFRKELIENEKLTQKLTQEQIIDQMANTKKISSEEKEKILAVRNYAKAIFDWHTKHEGMQPNPVDYGLSPFPKGPRFGAVSISSDSDGGCFLCDFEEHAGKCNDKLWTCDEEHMAFQFKKNKPFEVPPKQNKNTCKVGKTFKEMERGHWNLFYGSVQAEGMLNLVKHDEVTYRTCGTGRYSHACTAKEAMFGVTIIFPIAIIAVSVPLMFVLGTS